MKRDDMDSLGVTAVSGAGMDQYCITATKPLGSLPEMMKLLADAVSTKNAAILSQVMFVPPGVTGEGIRCLEAEFGEATWPIAWLEFPGGDGPGLVSSQTFAVSGVPVRRLEMDSQIVGSLFESDAAAFCLLGCVAPSEISIPRRAQCRQVFERIEAALCTAGMSFQQVMRTWFYLDRILCWYDDFNEVRDMFFAQHGISAGGYPASTGVGMANPLGAALIGSALAVRPKAGNVFLREVESPVQCAAPEYRSSFSRAVELAVPGCRSLHVSGTASIGRDGRTALAGDVDGQIELTVEAVRSLLLSRQMDWPDVKRAVAYFPDLVEVPRLLRCLERCGFSGLPLAIGGADICRADLLFEMEVEATTGRGFDQSIHSTKG